MLALDKLKMQEKNLSTEELRKSCSCVVQEPFVCMWAVRGLRLAFVDDAHIV